MAAARDALAAGHLPTLEHVRDELDAACRDATAGATRDRGEALLEHLRARVEGMREAALRDRLTACRQCGGRELLVAERCTLPIEGIATTTRIGLAVCAACGDLRMWCENVAALKALLGGTGASFRKIEVTGDRASPFR